MVKSAPRGLQSHLANDTILGWKACKALKHNNLQKL